MTADDKSISDPDAPDPDEDGNDRIAKVLARAGVASRREIERMISDGRVSLNGKVLTTPAIKVTASDILKVDGRRVSEAEAARVWRYHKPVGLVTTHVDPKGRPTVFDQLPKGLPRVISIGRLDLNSEGLLLLTNDGELARALELPSTQIRRRYRARARGRVTQEKLDTLRNGLTVEGVDYGPIEATLDKLKEGAANIDGVRAPANLWLTVTLTEGKNREVRKVLDALGLTVNRLIRQTYGPFQLGDIASGQVEEVGPRVIREQLAEWIAPEKLPQGNSVPAANMGASPRRTSATGKSALSGDAVAKTYKPGWAKPKIKPGHKRPANKPRRPKPERS